MKILSLNPGHDGAIAFIQDGRLQFSIEAEKDSNVRYAPLYAPEILSVLGEVEEVPDVVCTSGWWARDHYEFLNGSDAHFGYRGVSSDDVIVSERRLFGKSVRHFSSSHERAHLLCAFGMSNLPKRTRCYALIWEGKLGSFYEIDADLNITLVADVLEAPGNRYGVLYGLADPTFPKNGPFPRSSDAGKLMALASYSTRSTPSTHEKELMSFLLDGPYRGWSAYKGIENSPYHDAGHNDAEFRNFAGIFSDALFNVFYKFAKTHLNRGLPLLIVGGCGLNCDWNSKWRDSGLFSEVFVPPVANDSGAAIGTAIDAQNYFTGEPKIEWSVYSGRAFIADRFDPAPYDVFGPSNDVVANAIAGGLILGWVSGAYEIGPRALGNRSILAAPFNETTRVRLNEIKQREQFRPIAPVCLEEDALRWFGCASPSEHMLYTFHAKTDALPAVTHINGTARIQTVSETSNPSLYGLLEVFRERTGFGVLCNTSLNFNGRGFINRMSDLSRYVLEQGLDGFVVDGRAHFVKASPAYQSYLKRQL
ncbi:MAG: 3-hydroxymethylcephem carbamoyltransferase [Hyphomonadaceae bacterium]|nr:3-hydroxymethylcephem carbamoyltransferase [Hyphomonadaceae bacterium]